MQQGTSWPRADAAIAAFAGAEAPARPVLAIAERAAPSTLPKRDWSLSDGACRGRLLLVEDDSDMREFFAWLLRGAGYYTRTGANGAECLRLAKTMRPELILLNFLMPVMDGLTALRQLRMDPVISYLKVVTYSAVSNFQLFRATSLELGAVDCLQSPFDAKTLLAAVEKGLRG